MVSDRSKLCLWILTNFNCDSNAAVLSLQFFSPCTEHCTPSLSVTVQMSGCLAVSRYEDKSMINTFDLKLKAPIKEYRNSNFIGGDIAHTLELLSLGQHMQHATVML